MLSVIQLLAALALAQPVLEVLSSTVGLDLTSLFSGDTGSSVLDTFSTVASTLGVTDLLSSVASVLTK